MIRTIPSGPMPLHNTWSYKIRCQCCQQWPQIMGEVIDGLIYLRFVQWDREMRQKDVHWRWVDPETLPALMALEHRQTLRCQCCLPEAGRFLAEVYEGSLVLRGRRHGRTHFVTLSVPKIDQILAVAAEEAYAFHP